MPTGIGIRGLTFFPRSPSGDPIDNTVATTYCISSDPYTLYMQHIFADRGEKDVQSIQIIIIVQLIHTTLSYS